MPWREVSAMDERREFVRLALHDGANRRELCRRFGIVRMSATNGFRDGWPATGSSPTNRGARIRALGAPATTLKPRY